MSVLPAYAGMILFVDTIRGIFECAPRVCGDDPGEAGFVVKLTMCSPRMRG